MAKLEVVNHSALLIYSIMLIAQNSSYTTSLMVPTSYTLVFKIVLTKKKNFILVPIWLKYDRKEVNWSSSKNGLADIPLIAAQWLKHFLHQNGALLNELNVNI